MENVKINATEIKSVRPLLNDLARTPERSYLNRFLVGLILFMHKPLRLFELVENQKFDIVLKPALFFITATTLSFLLMVASQIYWEPSWEGVYEEMDSTTKISFQIAFTDIDAKPISKDSVGYAIHKALGYYEPKIDKERIIDFLKKNNPKLAKEIEALYGETEVPLWQGNLIFFACIVLLIIPWATLFHLLLGSSQKTIRGTINHSLYMFGMFMILAIPISLPADIYSEEFDFFMIAFFGVCLYFFIQDIVILKHTHGVKTIRIISANLTVNTLFIIIYYAAIYLVNPVYFYKMTSF